MAVDYTKITPIIVDAIKEQQAEITLLKKENKNLKAKLSEMEMLKNEIETLKKMTKELFKTVEGQKVNTVLETKGNE